MATRAAQAGVKVCAVHQNKFGPHVQRARRWLDEGRVGEILGVYCEFLVNPASDPMLALNGHWVNDLPGGRWFEVLPHFLYLMHMFTGRLRVGDVVIRRSPDAQKAAPAVGVMAALTGERCVAALHLAANSQLDKRSLKISGSRGTIEIAITRCVSTYTSLVRLQESRPVGLDRLPFRRGGEHARAVDPDRVRYAKARLREPSMHTRLMEAFVRHVRGEGPSPTSEDEIDSVVRCCAAIGRASRSSWPASSPLTPGRNGRRAPAGPVNPPFPDGIAHSRTRGSD